MSDQLEIDLALDLSKQLLKIPSITPNDFGCQSILIEFLKNLGFEIFEVNYHGVKNFYAVFGQQKPLIIFSGHTDVVPTSDEKNWQYPPFAAEIGDDNLYGRGSADMKVAISCMLTVVKKLIQTKKFNGSIGFLITSDEEGEAKFGTKKIVEFLKKNQIHPDFCLIGEASSENNIGDSIKIGRRGSLNAKLTIIGQQGHIAYPELANNPIHLSADFLPALLQIDWQDQSKLFPKTSLQISNIHAGTGASNVIPKSIEIDFNLRYSDQLTPALIKAKIENLLKAKNINYKIDWQESAKPFINQKTQLIQAAKLAIQSVMGFEPTLSTSGGTSDGRFICDLNCEIIELGMLNQTIHQTDEHVALSHIEQLTAIYYQLLLRLFGLKN